MSDFGRVFDLQHQMERYLDHVVRAKRPMAVFVRSAWQPAADVYETSDAVVALIDLPGVSLDGIELTVGRNSLLIRGERREPSERGERTYTSIEIPFGHFERTISFASPVDPEGAKASYNTGFLEVVMPKVQVSGPRRVSVDQA